MSNAKFMPRDDVQLIEFDSPVDQPHTDADDKADDLISALKDDKEAFVNVMRQPFGGNSRMEFVERIPADKYDYGQLMHYLGTTYGGGDYRLMVYASGKLKGNKLQTIAAKVKQDKQGVSPGGEAANILATVLQQIEANNERMMRMMSQMTAPSSSRADMLQEMLLYKQLFDRPSSGGLGELTQAIAALKELGVPIGNTIEHEKEEGFGELLAKMTPAIEAIATANNRMPPIDPQKARQSQMNMIQKVALKAKLEPFIKASIKKSAPDVYAEMLVDQMDEATLKQYIASPTAIDDLCKLDARIVANREWFVLLGEHVKAMLGMASTVSDLYDDEDSDITTETPENDDLEHDPT
jgi:hypothetical protein